MKSEEEKTYLDHSPEQRKQIVKVRLALVAGMTHAKTLEEKRKLMKINLKNRLAQYEFEEDYSNCQMVIDIMEAAEKWTPLK